MNIRMECYGHYFSRQMGELKREKSFMKPLLNRKRVFESSIDKRAHFQNNWRVVLANRVHAPYDPRTVD